MRALRKFLFSRLMFSWWLLQRGLTLGVRAIVLDSAGRVFLVRHSYVPGWHLPGGGVERGEDVLAALSRELSEEAGITVAGQPHLHGVFHNREAFAGDHVVVFVVRAFAEGTPLASRLEIVERGFFDVGSLPEATSAATRRRLGEVLAGEVVTRHW